MKTDMELKKLVNDELEWDPRIAAQGIGADCIGGDRPLGSLGAIDRSSWG